MWIDKRQLAGNPNAVKSLMLLGGYGWDGAQRWAMHLLGVENHVAGIGVAQLPLSLPREQSTVFDRDSESPFPVTDLRFLSPKIPGRYANTL